MSDESFSSNQRYQTLVSHFTELDSTQKYLLNMKLVDLVDSEDVAIIFAASADHQTNGMGKGDRTWVDDKLTKSVAMSFLFLHPRKMVSRAPFITQILAISAIQALRSLVGEAGASLDTNSEDRLSIKWPNDIMIGKRKVAGIIAQIYPGNATMDAIIIGIGMNLETPAELLESMIQGSENRWPPTSILASLGVDLEGDVVRAQLLSAFAGNLAEYMRGSEGLLGEISKNQFGYEARIQFRKGDGSIVDGVHGGLDGKGGIVIVKDDGVGQTYYSGEICSYAVSGVCGHRICRYVGVCFLGTSRPCGFWGIGVAVVADAGSDGPQPVLDSPSQFRLGQVRPPRGHSGGVGDQPGSGRDGNPCVDSAAQVFPVDFEPWNGSGGFGGDQGE